MATVQHAIDIKVPVHVAYGRLSQFEAYPEFMEEVEAVQRLDATHLHWTTVMANRPVEWDAEIIEQEQDRCIAWHNTSGPTNAGRVELQPTGPDSARVVFTLQSEPQQVPGSMSGYTEQDMALRLKLDLARMKDFIEAGASGGDRTAGQESGPVAPLGIDRGTGRAGAMTAAGQDQVAELGSDQGQPQDLPAMDQAGLSGTGGNPAMPASIPPKAALLRSDFAVSAVPGAGLAPQSSVQPPPIRHLGEMPQDTTSEEHGGVPSSDATGKVKPQDR